MPLMPPSRDLPARAPSIWWWAFGYFAFYVPYSALTKAVTSAQDGDGPPVGGVELLPSSVMASVVTSAMFLVATGWWRRAGRTQWRGWAVPRPSRPTLISGLCASGIIATTTLSYTFEGISIVFVMLLMRGGVLIMAPVIDALTGRRVRWFSWVALALSMASLLVASTSASAMLTLIAALDIAAYLGFYFARLRLMSGSAKATDADTNLRFFVEEQLVSSPALLATLALAALAGNDDLRAGFTSYWSREDAWAGPVIGVMSQGTGIFGALVLLDRRENAFCVPVNRASSILSGVVASFGLVLFIDASPPDGQKLIGAALVIAAMLFLSLPSVLESARARAR